LWKGKARRKGRVKVEVTEVIVEVIVVMGTEMSLMQQLVSRCQTK
jgi:hypothetical protein